MQRIQLEPVTITTRKQLADAVFAGDVNAIRQYVLKGSNPNLMIGSAMRGVLGDTPMHVAVRNKNYPMIALLISSPTIDLTIKNSEKMTPISLACNSADPKLLREIAKQLKNSEKLSQEDVDLLSIFMSEDLSVTHDNHYTDALLAGDLIKVQEGLDNSDLAKSIVDDQDNTALHIAVMQNNLNLIKLIMQFNPNLNAINKLNKTAIALAAAADRWPCMLAIYEGYSQISHGELTGLDKVRLNLVVKRRTLRASVKKTTKDKFIQASNSISPQSPSLAEEVLAMVNNDYFYLEEKVTKPGRANEIIFSDQSSGLHYAIENQNLTLIQFFMRQKNYDLTRRNEAGLTAFQLAQMQAMPMVMSCIASAYKANPVSLMLVDWELLKHFASIEPVYQLEQCRNPNEKYFNALRTRNLAALAEALLTTNSGIAVDENLNTGLHLAIIMNDSAMLGVLLKNSSQLLHKNPFLHKNKDKLTPIQLAAKLGHWEMIKAIAATAESENILRLPQADIALMIIAADYVLQPTMMQKVPGRNTSLEVPPAEYFILMACRNRHVRVMLEYVENDLDINLPVDKQLNTISHYLAMNNIGTDRPLYIEYNQKIKNLEGSSALKLAVDKQSWVAARFLVRIAKPIVSVKHEKFIYCEAMEYAYRAACEAGEAKLIALIIEKGVPVDTRVDIDLNTALHKAVTKFNPDFLSAIVKIQRNAFTARNKSLMTPLELAIALKAWDCVAVFYQLNDRQVNQLLTKLLIEKIKKNDHDAVANLLVRGVTTDYFETPEGQQYFGKMMAEQQNKLIFVLARFCKTDLIASLIHRYGVMPESIEQVFEDAISADPIRQPVCTPQGSTFEKSIIETQNMCPFTRAPLTPTMLVSNILFLQLNTYYKIPGIDLAKIPPLLICPLSGQLFQCPVVASDGITYERKFIIDYLNNNAGKLPSGAIQDRDKNIAVNYQNRIVNELINILNLNQPKEAIAVTSAVSGLFYSDKKDKDHDDQGNSPFQDKNRTITRH